MLIFAIGNMESSGDLGSKICKIVNNHSGAGSRVLFRDATLVHLDTVSLQCSILGDRRQVLRFAGFQRPVKGSFKLEEMTAS
jgi:hypothetical protein